MQFARTRAVLAAGLIAVVAATCGPVAATPSPSPSSTASSTVIATASPAPSEAATPAPTPSPQNLTFGGDRIGEGWRRVLPFPEQPDGSVFTSVTLGPPGFVAVGNDEAGAFAAVSAFGETWERVKLPGPAGSYVAAVASADGTIVAGGSTSGCCGIGGGALAWASSDGLTWDVVSDLPSGDHAGISSLAAVDGGFVAIGVKDASESGQNGIIWQSTDGRGWAPIPESPSFEHAWLRDVAAKGTTLVVVGQVDPNSGPTTTWMRSDGTWTMTVGAGSVTGVMQTVTATEVGWLAGGRIQDGEHARSELWDSTDGSVWSPIDLALPAGALGADVVDVANSQVGMIAVGSADVATSGGSDSAGAVWFAPVDGFWSLIDTGPLLTGQSGGNGVSAVAGASDRLVVVGGIGLPDAVTGAAWISPP